jgi:phosphate transport system protein
MTRTRYHQCLDDLKQKILAMGGMAETAVKRAVDAFQDRDGRLCELVLRDEQRINAAERNIDELALELLAMQQPVGVDLRFIVACIKINSDLERVGDQAVNIAERVLDLINGIGPQLHADIPHMAVLAINMVCDAIDAFITEDVNLARSVLVRDDFVDNLNREIFQAANKAMSDGLENHRDALDTLIIARNLERVADHATNIAEDVIFWVRGADVRHNIPA